MCKEQAKYEEKHNAFVSFYFCSPEHFTVFQGDLYRRHIGYDAKPLLDSSGNIVETQRIQSWKVEKVAPEDINETPEEKSEREFIPVVEQILAEQPERTYEDMPTPYEDLPHGYPDEIEQDEPDESDEENPVNNDVIF